MASASIERRRKPPAKPKVNARSLKRKRDLDDLESLEKAVEELDIKADIKDFSDLPLSQTTASGLEASHFKTLTDIQSKAIPLALKGSDILGAAKTGSGKTLAFLIPVLEKLYRARWTEFDGLGALIISPTRELAIQIFEVLRKIGRYHTFSAALVIGGGDLKEQQERLGKMNILVCTPGRMLQHMDQTAAFEVANLQVLVLDEADRIMDMGFQSSVDAIIEHLPKERQTLLFSATQTKKVSDLARLNLRDPEYVAVHEAATSATPSTLQQHYVVVPLSKKLDTLYGFIKANLKSKIIVFFSSAKQVRFVYETFRHLRPGIPLLHLHGRQKLSARLDVTSNFSASKNSCIFATDVVARGLDFPAVDWVIQLDCPEDADTYIHRVGRTARSEKAGKAVLILDPSEEEGMLQRLEHKKVPIQKINIRKGKEKTIGDQLQKMCFQDPELKYLGKKAFESYAKSLWLQKDKEIFNIDKYDLEGFHTSMGLPGAPKIKFRKGDDTKRLKNAPRGLDSDSDEEPKKPEVRTKYDRMFERRNQDVLSSHYSKTIAADGPEVPGQHADADEDEDFLSVKRVVPLDELNRLGEEGEAAAGPAPKVIEGIGKEPLVIDSKRREKLLTSKKALLKYKEKGVKMVFDDEGVAHPIYELEQEADFEKHGPAALQRAKFLEEEAERVRVADVDDKELAKQKKREKKEKRKAREAALANGIVDDDEAPMLVDAGDGEDPLALLASLPLPEEEEEKVDDSRPPKRPKKWFEDEEKERRPGHLLDADEEPETLEDLEALAAGLLN